MFWLQNRCLHLFAGQESAGIFLYPPPYTVLADVVQHFTIFALHPSKPYVSLCRNITLLPYKTLPAGTGVGRRSYLSELQKMYPTGYSGPFTIGVWWQAIDNKVTLDGH